MRAPILSVVILILSVFGPAVNAAEFPERSVGVVGCSNTQQAVEGYDRLGYTALWPNAAVVKTGPGGGIRGGSLERWADTSTRLWANFSANLEAYPQTRAVWFQICLRADGRPTSGARPAPAEFTQAEAVVEEIDRLVPGATVFVSPLHPYDGIDCFKSGPGAVEAATTLANHLVDRGLAMHGPAQTALDVSNHAGDRCHAGPPAIADWGADLATFFGTGSAPVDEGSAPPETEVKGVTTSSSAAASPASPTTLLSTGTTSTTVPPAASSNDGTVADAAGEVLANPDNESTSPFSPSGLVLAVVSLVLVGGLGIAIGRRSARRPPSG